MIYYLRPSLPNELIIPSPFFSTYLLILNVLVYCTEKSLTDKLIVGFKGKALREDQEVGRKNVEKSLANLSKFSTPKLLYRSMCITMYTLTIQSNKTLG